VRLGRLLMSLWTEDTIKPRSGGWGHKGTDRINRRKGWTTGGKGLEVETFVHESNCNSEKDLMMTKLSKELRGTGSEKHRN